MAYYYVCRDRACWLRLPFLRSACPPLQNQESQHMNLLLPMLPHRFRAMERKTESMAEQGQEIRRGQCQRRPSCGKHASSEAVSEFVAEILLISSFLYRLVSWHNIIVSHQIFFLLSCYSRARSVDVDTIIESIFSTTGDARLPQPVPLSQMIDLLVDFWEVRSNEGR